MSKLKVSAIHDPDNDNEALTIDTSGNVSFSGTVSGAMPDAIDVNASAPADSLAIDSSGDSTFDGDIKVKGSTSGTTKAIAVNSTATEVWHYVGSSGAFFRSYDDTENIMGVDSLGYFSFNSGFGARGTAYGVRAWVQFKGTGTLTKNGGGNVSSVTDNGTGDYTVNFDSSMPDDNYAVTLGSIHSSSDDGQGRIMTALYSTGNVSSGSFRIICNWTGDGTTEEDIPEVYAIVVR